LHHYLVHYLPALLTHSTVAFHTVDCPHSHSCGSRLDSGHCPAYKTSHCALLRVAHATCSSLDRTATRAPLVLRATLPPGWTPRSRSSQRRVYCTWRRCTLYLFVVAHGCCTARGSYCYRGHAGLRAAQRACYHPARRSDLRFNVHGIYTSLLPAISITAYWFAVLRFGSQLPQHPARTAHTHTRPLLPTASFPLRWPTHYTTLKAVAFHKHGAIPAHGALLDHLPALPYRANLVAHTHRVFYLTVHLAYLLGLCLPTYLPCTAPLTFTTIPHSRCCHTRVPTAAFFAQFTTEEGAVTLRSVADGLRLPPLLVYRTTLRFALFLALHSAAPCVAVRAACRCRLRATIKRLLCGLRLRTLPLPRCRSLVRFYGAYVLLRAISLCCYAPLSPSLHRCPST